MAIVKCPECKKDISNKAYTCPHCGFELKEKKSNNYLIYIIIALVLIGSYYFISKIDKYYYSDFLDISFKYKKNMQINALDDGILYISNNEVAIPYIAILRSDDYNSIERFITYFTAYIKLAYGNNLKSISQVEYIDIDDKNIGKITYTYLVNNEVVVDSRYVMVINDKVYTVFTKELENSKSDLTDVAKKVIKTLKEGK